MCVKKRKFKEKIKKYKPHQCYIYIRNKNKCVHFPKYKEPIDKISRFREVIVKKAPISVLK